MSSRLGWSLDQAFSSGNQEQEPAPNPSWASCLGPGWPRVWALVGRKEKKGHFVGPVAPESSGPGREAGRESQRLGRLKWG